MPNDNMLNENLLETAYREAINVLKRCINKKGLYASGGKLGYRAVWARDAVISLCGGSLADQLNNSQGQGKIFKQVFAKSLDLLKKNQSAHGQIPNCVGDFNLDRRSDVTFTTIDSSLWFIIGEYIYALAYHDKQFLKKHKQALAKALNWVAYQDLGEDHLPEQQPTSDWQDAFPHKYGHTINTQALYYQSLKFLGSKKEAALVKKIVNGGLRKDLKLFDDARGYYLPYIWKNHDGDREQGHWFDSSGNLLAIVTGLADHYQTHKILNYIKKNKVDRPYPVKAIYPPLKPGDPEWHSYFSKCGADTPYHYANAGIWPFLGGFYVAALVKAKRFKEASQELELLAAANKLGTRTDWDFSEWLDGATGQPTDNPYQAWSAGMYLFAYECVRQKKVLWFS
jgi:glycogen debranching enzyme